MLVQVELPEEDLDVEWVKVKDTPAYQEDILTMQEDFIIWHAEQEIQEEEDTYLEELDVSDI